ncbi:MAG TPA: hypothetical protein VH477_00785 [Bryobacteraceae bacterium]|jgi:hypothetical protein
MTKGTCPLTTSQIIDEYFIENRTRLLELAAFLERLDRSADGADADADFRISAFRRALRVLAANASDKMDQVQLLFSDPTTEPRERLDTKSASGAWDPASEVA